MWDQAAPGSTGYLVLDDAFARYLRIGPRPHIRGFRLVSSRAYPGAYPTRVLTYRGAIGH
jgi:hypothetical protein